jgi:hypothetical protein
MGHGERITGIIWLLIVLLGCGESGQADDGQAFLEEANPIVNDICNLRFTLGCDTFNDTVEECRIEILAAVGAQARFNDNDPACEATLFDLLDCHLEHPCDDVLDLIYQSTEPPHPCPSVQDAFMDACTDIFGS